MADRYWVGGTGSWTSTSTTNWSATSGGAAGASVPTAADNVIFDANSNVGTGAFTVTASGTARPCLSFTVTGLDGAMTFAGTVGVTVSGSMTLPATNFSWTNTGTLTFAATTSQTVTSGGNTITSPIVFNGTGGTWALQDALTCSGSSVTLTAGTLNLNNYTLTALAFNTSGTSTRVIAFGTSGRINLNGSGTVWNSATVTGFSYTGTSNVSMIYNSTVASTITTGSMTAAQALNFAISGAGSYTLTTTTGSVFNNLDFTGFTGTYAQAATSVTVFGNLTYASGMTTTTTAGSGFIIMGATSGTRTITTNGHTVNNNIRFNGVGGTFQLADNFTQGTTSYFNIVNGTIDFNNKTESIGVLEFAISSASYINFGGTLTAASILHTSGAVTIGTGSLLSTTGSYTFTAGTITINNGVNLSVGSFVSTNTNTRAIAFGTGSITTNGTGTVWNVTGVTGFSYTGTANVIISNNTATAVTVTNTAATAATAVNFSFINGTYTLTLTTGNSYNNLDFTGFAGTIALASTAHTMYGNMTLGSTTNSSATGGIYNFTWAITSATRTITTNGATVNFGIRVNGGLSVLQFADNFTQGATQPMGLSVGTLDVNSKTVNAGSFVVTAGTHAITNGTITAASVTHSAGDLSIGATYNLVCTGTYTFSAGSITINDSANLSVGTFSSTTGTRSIAFGTGSITTTGSGSAWNFNDASGTFSFTGTSKVNINNNTSTALTITNTSTSTAILNFNIVSGTYALTIATVSRFLDLNFTGFSGSVAFGTGQYPIRGNLTLSSTMTTSATAGTQTFLFQNTSGTNVITSNGATANFGVLVNGVGGTVQFADNFTQGATQSFGYTAGTVDVNSKNVTVGVLTILTGTHSIVNGTLGAASVTHTSGDLTVSSTATVNCIGTYTYTAGTINIGNGATLSVGAFSSANANARSIAFNTTGAIALTGTGTVWNTSTVTNFSYTGTSTVRLTNSGSTATTINTGAMSAAQALNFDITAGTYSLTTTTGSVFNDLDFTGFSGTYAQAATAITLFGNLVYSSTMSGSTTTGAITMGATAGTRTITTNGASLPISITLNGSGGTFQFADNFSTSGGTFSYTNGTLDVNSKTTNISTFAINTGTHSIINGTVNCVAVSHNSGTLAIGTGYLVACTGTYTLTAGTITINDGVTLSVGNFSSANAGTRVLQFGTGNITTTGTGTVWNLTGTTGLTTSGSNNVVISNNTSTACTITNTTTTSSLLNFSVINGTYALTLTTGNIYNNLDFTGFAGSISFTTSTHTIYGNLTLGSGMTTTANTGVATFTFSGTATCQIKTNGAVAGFGVNVNGTTSALIVQLTDAFVQGSLLRFAITVGTFDMAGYSTSIGTVVITTGAHAIANGTLNCTAVTHTSGDLSVGTGYLLVATGTYTFTAGTITINDGVTLSMGAFSSNNSNTRSIAFGTGAIAITGNATTVWNLATSTGFSFTGTPTINFTYSGSTGTRTVSAGTFGSSFTFAFVGSDTLSLTGTLGVLDLSSYAGTWTIPTAITIIADLNVPSTVTNGTGTGTITFNKSGSTITFTPSATGTAAYSISISANTTLLLNAAWSATGSITLAGASSVFNMNSFAVSTTGNFTVNGAGSSIANGVINCNGFTHSVDFSIGSGYNVSCSGDYNCSVGTLTINDGVSLVAARFVSSSSGATKGIAFGSGKLVLTGNNTTSTIFSTATGTSFFTFTGSKQVEISGPLNNAITFTVNTVGLTTTQMLNFAFSSGTYVLATTTNSVFNNLDFTGYTGLYNQDVTVINVYGDLILGTGMSVSSGSGSVTLLGSSNTFMSGTTTSPGGTAGLVIKISKSTGTTSVTLSGAFTTTATLYLNTGVLDTANYNMRVLELASLTALGATTRSLILGSSTLTVNFWTIESSMTLSAGTSTLVIMSDGGSTFPGSGLTYYDLYITTETDNIGQITITGNNTFNKIYNSNAVAVPLTLTFAAASTTTVSNFAISGSSTSQVTLNSSIAAQRFNLSQSSGMVLVSYVTIKDSAATGGATWRAPTNYGNINNSNNTGWDFSVYSVVTGINSNFFVFF